MRFRSLIKSVFKQNTNSLVSLSPRSHQISFSSHVITILTIQNAINLKIFWQNERFYPKNFHINSSAVYNNSAKNSKKVQDIKERTISLWWLTCKVVILSHAKQGTKHYKICLEHQIPCFQLLPDWLLRATVVTNVSQWWIFNIWMLSSDKNWYTLQSNDASSMFWSFCPPTMSETPQNMTESSNFLFWLEAIFSRWQFKIAAI